MSNNTRGRPAGLFSKEVKRSVRIVFTEDMIEAGAQAVEEYRQHNSHELALAVFMSMVDALWEHDSIGCSERSSGLVVTLSDQ